MSARMATVCTIRFTITHARPPHQGLVPDAVPVAHANLVRWLPRHVQGWTRADAEQKAVRADAFDDLVQPRHGGSVVASVLGGI